MSDKFTLTRDSTSDNGTTGQITDGDGKRIAYTIERPWADNQHDISCIPQGTYQVIRHHSAKFPNAFELVGVPNRQAILIHNGNTIHDTDGCILVGSQRGSVDELPAVLNSKITLSGMLEEMPQTFLLEITGVV